MFEIVGVPTAKPIPEALEPEIGFSLNASLDSFEALVGVDGDVLTDDRKRVASLREFHEGPGQRGQEISASLHWRGSQGRDKQNLSLSLLAGLSQRAIDHIETRRDKNPKKDVLLKLRIRANVIRSRATIFPVSRVPMGQSAPDKLVPVGTPNDASRWQAQRNDEWLLSGSESPVFLKIETSVEETEFRIPAEDWRHDFAPALGIGRFIVAELPVAESVTGSVELSERINEAVQAIKEMQKALHEGEWDEVVKASRPVAELLRSEEIWSALGTRLGFPDDAIDEFRRSINGTFQFASKFMHRTDREGGLRVPIHAAKEDAYLIYSLSVGWVNLLARKMSKLA